jgi:hypothetical protein
MKRTIIPTGAVLAVSLAWVLAAGSAAEAQIIRWQQIIGIMEAGNDVGSGAGLVDGGGQPWSTTVTFKRDGASLNLANGNVTFRVKGLVLAGGNGVGTIGGVAQVRGTFVCDTDGSAGAGDSVLVDTPLVPLSSRGDAQFQGNVGPVPAACASEPDIAFLIRTPGGAWIANGAVRIP